MSTVRGEEGSYSKQANGGNRIDNDDSDAEGCQDVPPFVMPPRRATVAIAAPIRTDSEASDITGNEEADEGDRMHFEGRPGRRPSAPASRMMNTNDNTSMMRRTTMPAGSLPTPRATGKNRTGSGGSGGSYPPTDYNDPQLATRTLMVYRFPREAQEVDLACRFGAFGPIEHVKVVFDPVTHLPRCYGFVRFCYRESCVMALKACEEGKIMMDDPFGRTWHFEAKWARNARAAGEIDRNGGEKEPQPPVSMPPKTFNDNPTAAEERGEPSLLPNPSGGGDSTNKSDETKTPTSTRAPASGATPGPADPFASFSDADLALINAATSPVISGIESRDMIDEDNSVQALSAKALEEAENLATSSAAAAAAAAALGHSGTSQADLAKLIETVFKAVRSSALAHLTGGTLGQTGGQTPLSQNATAMHDFLSSIVDEPSVLPPPQGEAVKRGSTNGSG